MLSTETLMENQNLLKSPQHPIKLQKKIRKDSVTKYTPKQSITIISPSCSDKTIILHQGAENLASGKKKKMNLIKQKVSPRSGSSSLTSEITSFDLNSFNEVGSSTSASHPHLNIPTLAQQKLSKSVEFSPLIQPYEDVFRQHYPQVLQLSPLKPAFSAKNDPSSRLTNWNFLPIEIQKAAINLSGNLEELQIRFDEYIPSIEMPQDSRSAFLKASQAQHLQENLVLSLVNAKEGSTLQQAFNGLLKENQRGGNANDKQVSAQKDKHLPQGKKPKKISKDLSHNVKSPLLESKSQNFKEVKTNCSTPFEKPKEGNLQISISPPQGQFVASKTAVPQGQQIDGTLFGGDSFFKNSTLSPRKGFFDEEVMSQQDLINSSQIGNNYEDFNYQFKLRKHMSDPYGDYFFDKQAYLSQHACNPLISNQQELDELTPMYEENNYYAQNAQTEGQSNHNHITQMETFKKDDDDILYGNYVPQNDTYEELINSYSKCGGSKSRHFDYNQNFPQSNQNGYYSYQNEASPFHSQAHPQQTSFQASQNYCNSSYLGSNEYYSSKSYQQSRKADYEYPQEASCSYNRLL